MERLTAYIDIKINELRTQYNPEANISQMKDKDVNREWSLFQKERDNLWRQVKSIDDVRRSIKGFCAIVDEIDKRVSFGNLYIRDEYDMAIALLETILAMTKIARSLDTIPGLQPPEFRNITQNDVDEMFDVITKYTEKMNRILVKKLMQG